MANSTQANPAPLALMGYGMTTILLNLHNTGLFAMDVAILAMGIFYGGIAQVLAGLLEFKKNNTFGLTAFTSYGMFWLSFVAILLLPEMGLAKVPDERFLGAWLRVLLWPGGVRASRQKGTSRPVPCSMANNSSCHIPLTLRGRAAIVVVSVTQRNSPR